MSCVATVQSTGTVVAQALVHMPSGPRILAFGSAEWTAVTNAVPPTLAVVALSSTQCAPSDLNLLATDV